jgi:hypothetical protein
MDPYALKRSIPYRGYFLLVSRLAKQWEIVIEQPGAPSSRLSILGWDEQEVIRRAQSRIDDLIGGNTL